MEPSDILNSAPFELVLDGDLVVLNTVLEDGSDLELVLGSKEEACEEMCRFLAAVDYGDCG